jgi:predicted DNA-binding protein with PD1-like motif
MRSQELTLGRTFAAAFDQGDDFYAALEDFCRTNRVRQGFVPAFIGAFTEVEVVGTCGKVEDPHAPVWSAVHLTNVETLGAGTIAYDEAEDKILPHVHVSVGLKEHSATAHTSHLLSAKVQFVIEMLIIEVAAPLMSRERDPDVYAMPLLRFGPAHA